MVNKLPERIFDFIHLGIRANEPVLLSVVPTGAGRVDLLQRWRKLRPRLRRFKLRQNRLQGCQPRRQRVAVTVDRAPEKGGKSELLVIGKVERHDRVDYGIGG